MYTFRRSLHLLPLLFLITLRVVAGEVHILGDDDMDNFVDNLPEDALLLVNFYKQKCGEHCCSALQRLHKIRKPGCKHCARLSPVLDYLEAEWSKEEPDDSKRWFKLAKVDCEKNSRLRTAIQDFAERMALVSLPTVSGAELMTLLGANRAVFVLASEPDADTADIAPGAALAAVQMQHTATFCKASQEELSSLGLATETLPAMLKVVAAPEGQEGAVRPAMFEADITTASSWTISSWIEKENYGLISEITPDNLSRLGALDKLLVMGVVDPKDLRTSSFKIALGKLATGFGLRHQDTLAFGIVNGVKFRGFAETLNIFDDLPRLVVLDIADDTFYSPKTSRLSTLDMEGFLIDVLSGGVAKQKATEGTTRYVLKIRHVLQDAGAWSLLLLIPVLGLFWVFCDTPQWEEKRAAAKEARRSERDRRKAAKQE